MKLRLKAGLHYDDNCSFFLSFSLSFFLTFFLSFCCLLVCLSVLKKLLIPTLEAIYSTGLCFA
jgi:hypothetical protein